MSTDNIHNILDAYCRFILKSGKEVYGVVMFANDSNYYFASNQDFQKYKATQNPELLCNMMPLNVEDIILAEKLAS